MIVKNKEGQKFTFNFNHIGYAKWVIELVRVDGERTFAYSDPFRNIHDCRRYVKDTIDLWYHDDYHGWCQRSNV